MRRKGTTAHTVAQIPVVPVDERRRILELPATRRSHRRVYRSMPFTGAVELSPPASGWRELAARARIVAWNVARCKNLERSAELLEEAGAEIVLLTEMDLGMARSGQHHTSREVARRIGCGYLFGVEYLELGVGDAEERARFAGAENLAGYHGAAILSPARLQDGDLLRLEQSGGWFDGSRGERRVGGRIALLSLVELGGVPLVVAAVHLESESDPKERMRQTRRLLDRIDSRYPGVPALIGGDFNTFSAGHQGLGDPAARSRLAAEDAGRFTDPVPYEPLFELAAEHGFTYRGCNEPGTPTERAAADRRGAMKIDWFLCRGLAVSDPQVLPAVDRRSGEVLSDHEAIAVTVSVV